MSDDTWWRMELSETARQLRELVREIERVCRDSPCSSVASAIINNATNHLCAVARIHEINAEHAARDELKGSGTSGEGAT
jgi:hypothetical protein